MRVADTGVGKTFGEGVQIVETNIDNEVACLVDGTAFVANLDDGAPFNEGVDMVESLAEHHHVVAFVVDEAPLAVLHRWCQSFGEGLGLVEFGCYDTFAFLVDKPALVSVVDDDRHKVFLKGVGKAELWLYHHLTGLVDSPVSPIAISDDEFSGRQPAGEVLHVGTVLAEFGENLAISVYDVIAATDRACRHSLGEGKGEVVLRLDHHLAVAVDEAVLIVDLDGRQPLREAGCRGVLRRDGDMSLPVDVSPFVLYQHRRKPVREEPGGSCQTVLHRLFFLPAFELGEVLAELLAVFIGGEVLAGILVKLVDKLDTEVYHLLHGAVLREVAIGEAVLAVVGIFRCVGRVGLVRRVRH